MPNSEPPSIEKRLDVLERDVRGHSRVITGFVDSEKKFSDAQLTQLKSLMSEALGNAGLRIDEDEHVDMAREDFRFLRRTRLKWDSAANRVGSIVLAAAVGLVLLIGGMGFWSWIGKGTGH